VLPPPPLLCKFINRQIGFLSLSHSRERSHLLGARNVERKKDIIKFAVALGNVNQSALRLPLEICGLQRKLARRTTGLMCVFLARSLCERSRRRLSAACAICFASNYVRRRRRKINWKDCCLKAADWCRENSSRSSSIYAISNYWKLSRQPKCRAIIFTFCQIRRNGYIVLASVYMTSLIMFSFGVCHNFHN